MKTPDDVLHFWFEDIGDAIPQKEHMARWFFAPAGTDERITELFATLNQQAVTGELDHWVETARGRLAAILLIDQFSRNIHRGSGEAFAHDARPLGWCKEGMKLGHDRTLSLAERMFFYLPLEHSENLEDQNTCVACYETMASEVEAEGHEYAKGLIKYAEDHRVIIQQFGRFPHRNAVLGRKNSPEEEAYLAGDAQRFGQ